MIIMTELTLQNLSIILKKNCGIESFVEVTVDWIIHGYSLSEIKSIIGTNFATSQSTF